LRRRIEPGWRYRAAQLCLRLLFGRSWHFISPWLQAGPAAGVVIFHDGKVLLHQRRGKIEQAGKWGVNGGYLDLSLQESFQAGIARELFEETGLQVLPSSFGEPLWVTVLYGQEKLEMADHAGVGCWYAVQAPHDILPLVQNTEEAHNYRWATEADVMRMMAAGAFNTEETCEILHRSFAAYKAGSLPIIQSVN
jgi:8-oxo-dGTP pyrophosphatase MutT (NUDIX family)